MEFLPILWIGAQYTALLTAVSLAISLLLGLAVALGRISRRRALSGTMAFYTRPVAQAPAILGAPYGTPTRR